jgi:nicotinate phosphoribosyltransferase
VSVLESLYRPSLALLTDLYELTMAYGYWRSGVGDQEAVFHLTFRHHPFAGGFSVACGLALAAEYLQELHFSPEDLAYLAGLQGNDGRPLFPGEFLDALGALRFACDVDAVPEGTVVFPQEPLVRVRGPLIQAQLVESALLNVVNFQTLIATKAARVCLAAAGQPVIEFGLRRAQGIDGALAASRAAYVGGCEGTSNVLAGRLFDIPVKGTHAHSWVMAFASEIEAFRAYAEAMPNNCIFLVDTYDTLAGVRHAVEVGRQLAEAGHRLAGIRLDSGDLAYLSQEARRLLDEAGFADATILASNDLDERVIESLEQQGAKIGAWGVGTRLVTGHDEPALGGVYKLAAIRRPGEPWRFPIKLSEQVVKISTPGLLAVRRFQAHGEFLGDLIYDQELGIEQPAILVDPADMTRRKAMAPDTSATDLLVPVFRGGERVGELLSLDGARQRVKEQLAGFHPGIKRFVYPHLYPVGLERRLHERKTELVLRARGLSSPSSTAERAPAATGSSMERA